MDSDYRNLYNQAVLSLQQGNLTQALLLINQAILLKPDSGNAYNVRAAIKSQARNHQGAFEDYTEAIRLDPKCADAYLNRVSARLLASFEAVRNVELEHTAVPAVVRYTKYSDSDCKK